MAGVRKSKRIAPAKSRAEHQMDLMFVLKEQLDLVHKQLNHFRGGLRNMDRLRGLFRLENKTNDGQLKFDNFEQNYRVWKKRYHILDKALLDVNLYDKLYDLYESLVEDDSITSKANLSDSSTVPADDSLKPSSSSTPIANDNVGGRVARQRALQNITRISRRESSSSSTSSWSSRASSSRSPSKSRKSSPTPKKTGPKKKNNDDFSYSETGSSSDSSSESSSDSDSDFSEEDVRKPIIRRPRVQKQSNNKQSKNKSFVKKFNCTHKGCDYFTSNALEFNKHKVTHCRDRPFKCNKCEWSFKIKGHLNRHLEVHEGKKFKCKFKGCGASYTNREVLRRHVKILHTNELPLLKCKVKGCDYSTHRNDYLLVHNKVHSEERPYKCAWPDCGQAFKTNGNLWNHKKLHENVRCHKCSFKGCSYTSNTKGNVAVHYKFMHKKTKKVKSNVTKKQSSN